MSNPTAVEHARHAGSRGSCAVALLHLMDMTSAQARFWRTV